jgi:translation initiation factor IF-2
VKPGHLVRLLRKGSTIGKAKVASVQLGKQTIAEATEGQECGMKIETRASLAVSDLLECYTEERTKREL